MSESHTLLEDIKQKISQLQAQREHWKAEANQHKSEQQRLQQALDQLKKENDRLVADNSMLKMAKSLNKGEHKTTETKLKINELVKEIDRCIALLSK